jgi:hypothetical protein
MTYMANYEQCDHLDFQTVKDVNPPTFLKLVFRRSEIIFNFYSTKMSTHLPSGSWLIFLHHFPWNSVQDKQDAVWEYTMPEQYSSL